eukprot:SAG31_NODE_7293_length_1729_cov_9.765031_1_plen_443_part_10
MNPLHWDPFVHNANRAYYVHEILRDKQGLRALWSVGASRLFQYCRGSDRGYWHLGKHAGQVPPSVRAHHPGRLQELHCIDGTEPDVADAGGAESAPPPVPETGARPAGGGSIYGSSPDKNSSPKGNMASPVFSVAGSPLTANSLPINIDLSAISALTAGRQPANQTTVFYSRTGREVDRSAIVQSQDQSYGHMTLMDPARYNRLPKDVDGVVKPESYFQQDMEEVLLTCMKPPLPTIKQRTPLSEVKMMLQGLSKRKAYENVVDWIRNDFMESGRSPEQLLFTFSPRRLGDLLHDVTSLPDGDIKRLIEDRDAMLDEMRQANYDAQQRNSERLMERQASMSRDLPTEWGTPGNTFWVWLKDKYYSRAENTKAGKSNKQNITPNDGPFAVTKVYPDKIHFEIDRPSWMERRQDPKFTIKAIRAIRATHPDPAKQLERSAARDEI